MMLLRFAYLLAAVALLLPAGAAELQMKARRVALFKNGYACVQLRGTLPEATELQLRGLPRPLFGTVDWSAPESVHITHLQARLKGEAVRENAGLGLAAFLRANVGRVVVVTRADGREFTGMIIAPEGSVKLPQSSFLGVSPTVQEAEHRNSMLVLRAPRGNSIAIPMSRIESVALADAAHHPAAASPSPELELCLSAPAPGMPVQLQYLTYGLSWLPVYRLEFASDGRARLEGRVMVMNELPDLENVQLDLITGYPPLGEVPITSPLVRLVNMKSFFKAFESGRDWVSDSPKSKRRQEYGAYRARAMLKEVDYMWEIGEDISSGGSGLGAGDDEMMARRSSVAWMGGGRGGQQVHAEDLFYYTIPDFSCRRGETVERDLFALEVPCRHVYTCSVPSHNELQQRRNENKTLAPVWHCVRLTNTGEVPWSTGIVSCSEQGRVFSRGILDYAAAGRETLLRLSVTTEASVGCREELLERREMPSKSGKRYISVYRGTLTFKNSSTHAMELELSKEIIGTPQALGEGGAYSITPSVYGDNPLATCSWKLHVEPGEEKSVTYTYESI